MSTDSKSIRLVTAIVERRPDGEYVPWASSGTTVLSIPSKRSSHTNPAPGRWETIALANPSAWPSPITRLAKSDPRISIPDICPSVRSPGRHQGTSGLCTESCCALGILTHTVQNIRFNSRGRSLLPGISTRRHLCWRIWWRAFVQGLGTAYNWMYRAGELLGHFVLHTHLLNHKDIFHLEGNILCGIA